MSGHDDAPLLEIAGLTVALPRGSDRCHAIEDLSLELRAGEIVCLVGESGSGKSVTAAAIMGLLPPTLTVGSGQIRYRQHDLLSASEAEIEQLRGRELAMIFQEPATALNPVYRIGTQIEEVLELHTSLARAEREERVISLLREVNLPDPGHIRRAYPHQLSGGQCRRAMIAMALALNAPVLIADEPTTALDVTTQARILALIRDLQSEHRSAVLFITHDFGVVADMADRVVVMQQGRAIESGIVTQILDSPRESYTRGLVAAVPRLDIRRRAQRNCSCAWVSPPPPSDFHTSFRAGNDSASA